MERRGTNGAVEIAQRVRIAEEEILAARADVGGVSLYDHFVENADLEATIAENLGAPQVAAFLAKAMPEHGATDESWAPSLTAAEAMQAQLIADGKKWCRHTAIEPAMPFWQAEEYHQKYLAKMLSTNAA